MLHLYYNYVKIIDKKRQIIYTKISKIYFLQKKKIGGKNAKNKME